MHSELKPIKVWGQGGPNPPKVAMILGELEVPYEVVNIPSCDVKKPEYLAINPNGRTPAIQDPNTGLTLWESGAIVEYLIERYDTNQKISFEPGSHESYHAKQWLFFQTTGQAPYYGQSLWFRKAHPEELPSAIERYIKEVNRVTGVLEERLIAQRRKFAFANDGPWLVGDKLSYADIAFVPWQLIMPLYQQQTDYDVSNYPHVKEWMSKLASRRVISNAMEKALSAKLKN